MTFSQLLRAQWDRVLGVVMSIAGVGALVIGWLGASRSGFPAEQIPYILSGGLLGLCLVAIGTTLWLSADLRDEWRKLDDLDERLEENTAALKGRETGETADLRTSSLEGDLAHLAQVQQVAR
ncbi:MAG TPA: hypothetical protein VFE55_21435 [Acidimicrobiia bacterium]|nr:hypothetical protein [Acidimicrobiia bacterium]